MIQFVVVNEAASIWRCQVLPRSRWSLQEELLPLVDAQPIAKGRPGCRWRGASNAAELIMSVEKGERGLAPSVDQLAILAFLRHLDQRDLPALRGVEHGFGAK
jgi:hypothetical protein